MHHVHAHEPGPLAEPADLHRSVTDSGPSWREIALRVMNRVISHTTQCATRLRTRSLTTKPTRAARSISARYRTPASGSR